MRMVISASRRTDIPAHYYDWLREGLRRGVVEVTQPGTGNVHTVSLRNEDVHTLVLWSKDFRRVIRDLDFWRPQRLYFNFTLNDCPFLEPYVPPLADRIEQMAALVSSFGADRINWRFDPVVYWDEGRRNNLGGFLALADRMAELGLRRCTFSFMTVYRKTIARGRRLGIGWFDPPLPQKREVAAWLADQCRQRGIALFNCCNDGLEGIENLSRGRCIDGLLLARLADEPCSVERDRSQRPQCGCTVSRDIGSYWMLCSHACSYCYANPAGR
ncbi:MAG: DUF1848 domain-containing protein [Candidatus Sumerlaeia bacterium]|nr:DUF1848 domain-containing protein [Candidatus Sumerlaeia bacterium]